MVQSHEFLFQSTATPVPLSQYLQLLNEATTEALQCDNPIGLVDSLFQRLNQLIGIECYSLFTADARSESLRLVSYSGLTEEIASVIECFETVAPNHSADHTTTAVHFDLSRIVETLEQELAAYVIEVLPLQANRRLLGLLVVGTHETVPDPQRLLLQSLANQIASVIERRRIRSQLELERDRFNALMDHIPAGVMLAEAPSGRIVLGNSQVKEILGTLPEETVDASSGVKNLLTDGYSTPVARSLRGELVQGDDYLYQRSDGSQTWIRASSSPIRDRTGRIIGSVVTCYDIDQEKRAEAALRESEEHFRLLANAAPQIVWAADAQGRVDYMNQKWFETTGLTAEQTYSAPARWSAIHPEDLNRILDAWHASLKSGDPLQQETRYRMRDGSFRWHLVRAIPVRDQNQQIIRWLGTCTDIDGQKRAEEALREADRSKDVFLAMLGHELRNPLAAVMNAMSLLQTPGIDHDSTIYAFDIMHRQLGNMSRMLDDLLDLARVKQGKVRLQVESLDLVEVIRRATTTVQPYLQSRQHQLQLFLPKEPIWLDADSTRLEQVFVNLLNNACKYTPTSGKISIQLTSNESESTVTVTDNGIGMTAESLSTIFEMFAQAENSISQSQGGLGVGLTMVKSLVNMHGGYVRAHSGGLGQGSEISVTFPMVKFIPAAENTLPSSNL